MYLLYLDDSGSVSNRNESYLVLGGVMVFERQVHWLSEQIQKIALAIDASSADSIEFHASNMFSGREAPWKGMSKPERRAAISEVLGVLADSHETTLAFACAVHKTSYLGQDAMEIAFEELCSRFEIELKKHYHADNPQRGIIILDKSSYETSLQRLASRFSSHGTRWGVLRNMAEVPLFVDSRASRLVQLADHVAYAVFRRYEKSDTSYLDLILKKFKAEDGRLHGLVHKQTIDSDCMCPACMSRRLLQNPTLPFSDAE